MPFNHADRGSGREAGPLLQLYSVVYGGASQVMLAAGDTAGVARADSVAREVTEDLAKDALL